MKSTFTKINPAILLIAVFAFASASYLGPVLRIEPFYSWFYLFAWWPYIIAVEAVLHKKDNSLLFETPGSFFRVLPVSLVFWLFFELLNFRLQNWHYINLPSEQILRWMGYIFSFSTVIPGIYATKRLLTELGVARSGLFLQPRPMHQVARWLPTVGLLCLVLPMLWPKYFFPLVWGCVFFFLEPVLYFRKKSWSFLADIESGTWKEVVLWLAAGGICGLLWEMWNFWAGAKWFYTIPFVGKFKLFEMPVLGFLGFPPFALECAVALRFFWLCRDKMRTWPSPVRLGVVTGLTLGTIVFVWAVCTGIDHFTVISFRN